MYVIPSMNVQIAEQRQQQLCSECIMYSQVKCTYCAAEWTRRLQIESPAVPGKIPAASYPIPKGATVQQQHTLGDLQ